MLFKGAISHILLLPQPTVYSLAEGGPATLTKTTAYEEKEQAEEVFGNAAGRYKTENAWSFCTAMFWLCFCPY